MFIGPDLRRRLRCFRLVLHFRLPAHLDKFSHIGVFSGGSIAVTNITEMVTFKEKVKLVFISYGNGELGTNRAVGRGFGDDFKANTAARKESGQRGLLRIAQHRARKAKLPAQFAGVRAPRVQGLKMNGKLKSLGQHA